VEEEQEELVQVQQHKEQLVVVQFLAQLHLLEVVEVVQKR
jgi:hypothetical protein